VKTLILVRHAESDKGNPSLNDFDCPLNSHGARDARILAERMAGSGLRIDALISSPAVRALATAEAFAIKISIPVQTDECIYEAGANELLALVRGIDERCSTVILVGHNPGVSEFLRYLTDEHYADLPTASVAVVELPVRAWRHTFAGKGILKSNAHHGTGSLKIRSGVPIAGWVARFRVWRFQRAQRLEIIVTLSIVILLLLILVPLIMHLGVDTSAMPQQGSPR
jgi:phosphohistidine phosphatase